ncbi:MAG: protein translocase subunit SecD, partial [Thermoanaerobaculales bacterium]|nr:protein translocase subunit SecD [Thermoanaerobaculales bacterium]
HLVTLLVVLAIAWGGVAAALAFGVTPVLGLDLKGGTSVILRAPDGTDPEVLDKAVEVMRRRIESFGSVQEPEIQISGDNNVLVQLPGVTDRERALAAIGQTGQLSFRPVLEANDFVSPALIPGLLESATTTTEVGETTTTSEAADTTTTTEAVPTTTTTFPAGVDAETGLTVEDDPTQEAWLAQYNDDGLLVSYYHVGPSQLSGADLDNALAGFQGGATQLPQWQVQLDLSNEGADKFQELTKVAASFSPGDPRRQIAIVLDGEVVSAPQVNADVDPDVGISGGSAVITMGTGENQQQEAQDLAVVLRYGSLPVAFERDQVQNVSATLGADSLNAGLLAGAGGLILVALAVMLYYRSLGLLAVLGLTVFGSLLLLVIGLLSRYMGTTLTLAGVTGIIVSIGITADSYIVFYERIKEEIRAKRTLHAAVDEGFSRAFHTILTADTVSILAAILLWLLAVGPVKGFALTLGIATLLDIIVAYFFTRNAVWLMARTKLGSGGWFSIEGASGRRVAEATP